MSEDRDEPRTPAPPRPPSEAGTVVSLGASGELVLSAEVLQRAGIAPGQDVAIDATSEGVRIVADALRKVHVEITSHCNLDCVMCARHGWREPLGHMPVERFERLISGLSADARGGLTLAFSGFGEPLVHPGWAELMRLARAGQHPVELITNGLLLDGASAERLVDLGVAQVTVSVDGTDDEAYTRMRGVPPMGALAAVHHLLEARRHTRRPMSVGVAAVATRRTVGSLPALLDWAHDLKLDFVSIGNLVPHTEEMAGEVLWQRAGWSSVFTASSWRPRVRVGRVDIEESTRPLAAALAERELTYPAPSGDSFAWRNRCRFAWEGMCAVSWDGRVAPCLSLLHAHTEFINSQARRVGAFVVGDVDGETLDRIWRREPFRSFRQRVRAFDFPPCFHCGGCPLTETNAEDCYGNPAPVCGECLWAQGIVLCP